MDFLHNHNIVLANISEANYYYTAISTPNQYFGVPQFMQRQNEYLAGVGAFSGDSLERFIWTNPELKKIYAFEPAKRQFNTLEARIKRLNTKRALEDDRITAVNIGIGEHPQQIGICEPTDFTSFNIHENDDGGFEFLDLISIDDYFKNRLVSFLKADIEGAEMLMLKGAHDVIREQMPNIAVCTYHYISDLTDIVTILCNSYLQNITSLSGIMHTILWKQFYVVGRRMGAVCATRKPKKSCWRRLVHSPKT